MKRIILFLFVILTSNGWLLANHWTPDSASFEDNMTLTGIVQINGVEQQNTGLEVGVFCGEECRGSDMVVYFAPTQHYVIQMLVFGENGDQLTFKLFDHSLNQELDLVSPEAIVFTANGYGNLTNPYVLNFTGACVVTATANPSEGGTVTGAGTYPQGATAILVATANEGYTFVNWTKGGEVVSNSPTYTLTVTEAANYVANFNGNHWTPNSAPYEDNMSLTGVVLINFVEQQTTALEVGAFCGEECRGAGRLVYFSPTQQYVVQLLVYGNSGDELSFKLYDHEQNAELELVSPEAITFTENGYGSLANPYVLDFLETFDITVSANPTEGGTTTGAGTYNYGTTVFLNATANTGYHFVNWTLDGETVSTELTYSFEVTGPADYVAIFELNSYDVTAVANPTVGGTVTGAGTYNHFETCTLTAMAATGYHFVSWTLGSEVVSNSPTYSFEVTGAADYVANFELNSYEVTAVANPTAGGAITGAGTYNHFATATLTATANEGYTFINWTKDGVVVTTELSYSFEVTEAASFVANFSLNSYEITVSANPTVGGTVTGAGTYNHFETCTLTATANEGYAFTNWAISGEVVSIEPTYSFTVTNDADFIANFELTNITQTTNFVSGWTWWSTYIETTDADVLDQLKTGLGNSGQVIKSQTASTMHLGNNWVGSLPMNNEGGYMVKSNAEALVDITGPATMPENHPITLNPGWTWIGYPCTEQMTVAEALANHVPQPNDVIKTQNASAVYMLGSWRGSLTLTPGVGYMYKSNAGSNITLTYATPTGRGDVIEPEVETHWMANYHAYPTNMTVVAVVEIDGKELALRQAQGPEANYELAAFASSECRGSVPMMYVEPLDRYLALLTISGEEAAELRFALYNTETGEEYHNANETLIYETDAVIGSPEAPFVIRFHGNTGLDESEIRYRVYPNPVSNMLNIEGVSGEYSYALFNGMVQMVVSGNAMGNTQINVNGMAKGVYFLRLNTGTQVRMEKVVVE